MKKFIFLLLFFIVQIVYSQTTTIYLIRHSEKDSIGNNPQLSEKGVEQALAWARYFDSTPIDYFYTTNTKRTQQTCASIASSKQKNSMFYELNDFKIKDILLKHKGKTILIVGHSNTIPEQINTFLGIDKYQKIDEVEFGNLYKITEKGDLIVHELLQPFK